MPSKKPKVGAAAAAASAKKSSSAVKAKTTTTHGTAHAQRTRATAKFLVEQHGPLTQLNDQYALDTAPAERDGSSSRHSTVSSSGGEDWRAAADRRHQEEVDRRRLVLLRLPSECLPVYVQLAESGLPTSQCAFAAIITRRAMQAQEATLAAQAAGHV